MSVTELLTDITASTNAIIRNVASKLNLTASQAFHLLSIPFDGIPMSRLANRLGLDNSTLTRNIQKLEKMDLVERNSDNYDKRIQLVVLSKRGASLLELLEENLEHQSNDILKIYDYEKMRFANFTIFDT